MQNKKKSDGMVVPLISDEPGSFGQYSDDIYLFITFMVVNSGAVFLKHLNIHIPKLCF